MYHHTAFLISATFVLFCVLKVESYVTALNHTFAELLTKSTWMDASTKRIALEKLKQMLAKIGYPEWLFDDAYINKMFEYTNDITANTSYINVYYDVASNNYIKYLASLRVPYNRTNQWGDGPAVVNAFYDPTNNEISFPAAILDDPFFHTGLPTAANLGSIGAVIGHELTHAFDDSGSQYGPDGTLENWWTNSTRQQFLKRADCFVKQYGSVYDPEAKLNLNGKNTQGENIADNEGLKVAFLSYQKLKSGRDKALPGLEKFSQDQLFFISNGMIWCESLRKEYLKYLVQYDPHSPSRYRVNIPFKNFQQFAKTFGCKPGSNMVIANTCTMW